MSYSHAFICLSYLFTDSGFKEHDQEEQDHSDSYTYFKKNGITPIQINRLKVNYSELELSSYALRAGKDAETFIDKYNTVMAILKKI